MEDLQEGGRQGVLIGIGYEVRPRLLPSLDILVQIGTDW